MSKGTDNHDPRRPVAIALCGVVSIIGFLLGIPLLMTGDIHYGMVSLLTGLAFVGFGIVFSVRRGRTIAYMLMISAASVLCLSLHITGGASGMGILWGILVPVASPFFLGLRCGMVFSTGYVLLVMMAAALGNTVLPWMYAYPVVILVRFVGIYCTAGVIVLVYEFSRDADRQVLVREVENRRESENRLAAMLDETERINRLMSGREDRVIELKRQVNALSNGLGRGVVYPSVEPKP